MFKKNKSFIYSYFDCCICLCVCMAMFAYCINILCILCILFITSHQTYCPLYTSECVAGRFPKQPQIYVYLYIYTVYIQYNCTYIYSLAIMHHMSHQTNCPASMEKICITVKDLNRNVSRLS